MPVLSSLSRYQEQAQAQADALQQLAPQPCSVADTGLTEVLLVDLLCKHLHDAGVLDMPQLVERLALPGPVLEELLAFLRKDGRIEVLGQVGSQGLRYGLTERGRSAARDALARSGYLGPAPYPVDRYRQLLLAQTVHHCEIDAHSMHEAFADIVIRDELLDQLGPAMNSGRAMMIYGPPGTGKTYISQRLIRLFSDAVWIPHAIAINETVLEILDPQLHKPLPLEPKKPNLRLDQGVDRRLVRCQRPIVITGGELTMDMLDVRFDPYNRQYQAPLQLKASNGIFIIDDLGRQRMPPLELFNRWIVPMEEKKDFLNLGGGRHCEIPFDLLLVFSTNLNPLTLADEAFLRRIGYKLHFEHLRADEYARIWQQECEKQGVPYDPELVTYVIEHLHQPTQTPLLPCHPRDLLGMALDRQRYLGGDKTAALCAETLSWAWRNYFVSLETS
ncbi:AAA family ATPase [Pseudomonas sp. N040]|uniref:AAA family ATPase n=1 Tax=Pseudomonas sp. N040 TaxID=2785325 RepID=UPI0018A2C8E4|nr:AAA family ATPase [Pseudomonas sp. N040]MBF7728652.1 AAA family ATPase [Pseudomonas sp. N040]MBW7012292.1 AAA family ATPase [Pseudomonas sp. N040]